MSITYIHGAPAPDDVPAVADIRFRVSCPLPPAEPSTPIDQAAQARIAALSAWDDVRAAFTHAQKVQSKADRLTAAVLLDAAAYEDGESDDA
jgi:hypothetical protein